MRPGLALNDLDLWVRDRRERLTVELIGRGARLVRDFHPYCVLFDLEGTAIEITYQNVKTAARQEIVRGFDLANCAIGAAYAAGEISKVFLSSVAVGSARSEVVCLEPGYLERLREERLPTVLRSIDRMERFADETGYRIVEWQLLALWEISEHVYSPQERQECIDVYISTSLEYKGISNPRLLERAGAGVTC